MPSLLQGSEEFAHIEIEDFFIAMSLRERSRVLYSILLHMRNLMAIKKGDVDNLVELPAHLMNERILADVDDLPIS
jgi:hypothetical protein